MMNSAAIPPPGTQYRTPLGEQQSSTAQLQTPAWHTPFSAMPLTHTGTAARTAAMPNGTGSSNESAMSYKFGTFPVAALDLASTPRFMDNPLAALSPTQDDLNKENY